MTPHNIEHSKADWTSGYVADIGYTYGYYSDLNPLHVKLAFLNVGLAFPTPGTACELGFGQGVSANLHAAASVTRWYGTDFNPAQAAFARELADISGTGAQLFGDAFADFANRTDLPDFDYIGVHGIWSWISNENRGVIVDFIRRKLKVGGVLYISYNTFPGWATLAPVRHLLAEHADIIGAEGHGIISRIDGALEFADKLLATHPNYAKANPKLAEFIKTIKDQDRHYLAHEYFNRDWHPMHVATMAEWLATTKLSYACSANYLDHVDGVNFTTEQHEFLKAIPDAMFRETVRDFMVNQHFRRDYWVKGARRISLLDKAEALRAHKVLLVSPRADVALKVTGAAGEATLNERIYVPILDVVADHKARTVAQIEQAVAGRNITFGQLIQGILVLSGVRKLCAVQDDATVSKARKNTDRINAYLINRARGSDEITFLASPVTGGGVAVDRFQQLFILARSRGQKLPSEWAQFVWESLAAQGQKIVKEGKHLETADENLAELNLQASAFAEKTLPILRALQIGA